MRTFIIVILISFVQPTLAQSYKESLKELGSTFTHGFRKAIEHEKIELMKSPIIVNDLHSMTLYIHGKPVEHYQMPRTDYKTFAEMSHIQLVVYAYFTQSDWQYSKLLSNQLTKYQTQFTKLIPLIKATEIDPTVKKRFITTLEKISNEIDWVKQHQAVNKKHFLNLIEDLRTSTQQNLIGGAKTQITHFHEKVQTWQNQYPNEKWHALNIAVIGPDGGRQGNTLWQYFRWLTHEPNYNQHVIYVELTDLRDMFKHPERTQQLALMRLASHKLQLKIGFEVMHDPAFMQSDVMAQSARKILESM